MNHATTSSFIFSCLGSVFLIGYTLQFLKSFSAERNQLLKEVDSLVSTISGPSPALAIESLKTLIAAHTSGWAMALRNLLNKKEANTSFSEFQFLKNEVLVNGLDLKFFKRMPHRLVYATLVFVVLSLFFGLYDLKAMAQPTLNAVSWTSALVDTLVRFLVAFVGIACSLYCARLVDDAEQELEHSWSLFSAKLEEVLEGQRPVKEHAVKVEIEDSLTPMIRSIAHQLELFAEKSHNSLRRNLEEFDGALADATAKLSSSVKEMNKHLEQVETILENNNKVA